MRRISLRVRLYGFFVLFGLIPLAVVSYFSVDAYTRSISAITESQVSDIVKRIAGQIDLFRAQVEKDLEWLASQPYVQVSFVEYQFPYRLGLIREKLEHFRVGREGISRLSLQANSGMLVVTTPQAAEGAADLLLETWLRASARDNGSSRKGWMNRAGKDLIFFTRVYDYQDETRPVGFVSAQVALDQFTQFLQRLDIGQDTKMIETGDGTRIVVEEAAGSLQGAEDREYREYTSQVEPLNWRIIVRIPVKTLFQDVHRLVTRNISFIVLVVLLAISGSLALSTRITRPFEKIIVDINAFARGNLDHRIEVKGGREAKGLADAFNAMAEQLKQRQSELVQYNKLAALGLISAGIAHEVRNPLASIKTSAQVISGVLSDSASRAGKEGREYSGSQSDILVQAADYEDMMGVLGDIAAEVDRLNQLVVNLLDSGRPRPPQVRECDVGQAIERALRILDNQIKTKRIRVRNEVSSCIARVDTDQMTQVFINLTLNAISAVEPDTGTITFTPRKNAQGELVIKVADNGRGIPEEKIGHIFDPFFSLSKEGTGLGLSVVYTLLSQNDVRIVVASRVGDGTAFDLTFKSV
jgi:signal transduction histidine kinase